MSCIFATERQPPYCAVIFTSRRADGENGYVERAYVGPPAP